MGKTSSLHRNPPGRSPQNFSHNLEAGKPGIVQSMRNRFLSMGEVSMEAGDLTELRNSLKLSKNFDDPNHVIHRGTVKDKANEFKKKNQTLISPATERPQLPPQCADF